MIVAVPRNLAELIVPKERYIAIWAEPIAPAGTFAPSDEQTRIKAAFYGGLACYRSMAVTRFPPMFTT